MKSDNEGGYLIAKEDVPKLLHQAFLIGQEFLEVLAFRLLCEATKQRYDDIKGEQKENDESRFVI